MARKKVDAATKAFIKALDALEEERGITKATVLDALKEALEKSYKKNYLGPDSIVNVEIDEETGKIRLFEIKHVVDDVMDEDYELSEEEAKEIDPKYEVGDDVITEVSPEVFGRLAAIQTKQILRQKIREAEKEALYNEYVDKKDDIITGIVDRVEERFAIINIGKTGALLPLNAQIPGEVINEGQHLKVYVSDVEKTTKGTHIGVSRTEPGLVKRLFEMEVPEIYDGTVEIKSVSREPGERSKIAVFTDNEDIDPIGACVGPKGTRVRNVVTELNEEENSALVVVPDNQLSLAIGKRGQNARLAVRLTGWKIDIKSESEIAEEGIDLDADEAMNNELLAAMEETHQDDALAAESFDDESFDEEESINVDIEALREEHEEEDTDYVKVIAEEDEAFEEENEPEYDPKFDEDIDYDEYDKYYD